MNRHPVLRLFQMLLALPPLLLPPAEEDAGVLVPPALLLPAALLPAALLLPTTLLAVPPELLLPTEEPVPPELLEDAGAGPGRHRPYG